MLTANGINYRALLAFWHDVAAAAVCWCLAYLLRFNLDITSPYLTGMWQSLVWVVPVQAIVFWLFGLYRGIWRYASLPDLKRILAAVAVAALVGPMVLFMLRILPFPPRSVLVLDPIFLVMLMGGSRFAYRIWKEHRLYGALDEHCKPVLVLGTGDAAAGLVRELSHSQEWRVVGLLDDNMGKHGRLVHGVRVLGGTDDLPAWAEKLGVSHAIIAMPAASHEARRRAVEVCNRTGVSVQTVPSFDDLMSGKVTVSQIRRVEVDDLLGRDPVILDNAGLNAFLRDRVVMVTGAGGSIGSELSRQIARFQPKQIVLLELNEFALYNMEQEFNEYFPDVPIVCAIGDVKNAARVEQILREYSPTVIFHAAAYKHVPLMENENAWEAVQNNVLGTYVLARAAIACGVEKFILISTDKAVNPANVMGASKRLAEMLCQGLQRREGPRFVIVRFGNVLGSTGSVIPKFQEQIAKGGPVTVTHSDVIRYFMSIQEASQLVLQAGLMGKGGDIFVMDMGEPVRIKDLACDMIRLSGFSKDEIRIVYTGLRPGEKLFEELIGNDEDTLPTTHPKLRIARSRRLDGGWIEGVMSWLNQGTALSDEEVRNDLKALLPEFVLGHGNGMRNEVIAQPVKKAALG